MRTPEPELPTTLPAALERAARHFGDRGIAVLDGRGRRHEKRMWNEVLAGARRAAGQWAEIGVGVGDRVVITLPTSWEWLDAWLGATLRGAYPVAVAPGGGLGPADAVLRKVDGVVERLDARFVIARDGFRTAAESAGYARIVERTVTPEELFGLAGSPFTAPVPTPEDDAFLQLTSGSTGMSRAVRIPHRAVLHNARAIDEAIGAPDGAPARAWADALVSWLPLHHDMGLVGCLFVAMLGGLDLWLLPPATFLARPRLWLDHLGRHGKTFGHAPNFGYQLCVERLDASGLDGLDLSGWRHAMTGAEMVRPETVRAFSTRFGSIGFRPEVFRPCYGLAEATLAATLDLEGRGLRTRPLPGDAAHRQLDPELTEVACLGPPVADTSVRIVGADGQEVPEGTIGEVRISGPGVFGGYWNDPEATAEALVDGPQGVELTTGDLGFLHVGELYLTGRTKDLLIVRGTNWMPHEIEWLAENVTGGGGALRSGAFSVPRGGEGEVPIVVVETSERDPDRREAMARDIRLEISKGLGLVLAEVVFVRRGAIPKTTSGKVQRRALRAAYLGGELS
ncbi:MAG: AMP-binding protein [Acidobacteriota bacterium]